MIAKPTARSHQVGVDFRLPCLDHRKQDRDDAQSEQPRAHQVEPSARTRRAVPRKEPDGEEEGRNPEWNADIEHNAPAEWIRTIRRLP